MNSPGRARERPSGWRARRRLRLSHSPGAAEVFGIDPLSPGARHALRHVCSDQRQFVLALVVAGCEAPAGAAPPIPAAQAEMAEAAEKREQQIVAATEAAIEKHRKADAGPRRRRRRPAAAGRQGLRRADRPRVPLRLQHLRFDRCRTTAQNAAYKRRFAELFNYATVGFYWRWYEPQRGQARTMPTPTRSWPGAASTASA